MPPNKGGQEEELIIQGLSLHLDDRGIFNSNFSNQGTITERGIYPVRSCFIPQELQIMIMEVVVIVVAVVAVVVIVV